MTAADINQSMYNYIQLQLTFSLTILMEHNQSSFRLLTINLSLEKKSSIIVTRFASRQCEVDDSTVGKYVCLQSNVYEGPKTFNTFSTL